MKRSTTKSVRFGAIVDSLPIAVLVFRDEQLVYSNTAAHHLAARLRSRHKSELSVVLRDHLRGLGDKLERGTVVSLLTARHGEPFYIYATPIGSGAADVAISIRELGMTMGAFTQRYRLSRREAQIVELVMLGYRNRDIAGALGTAPATIKKHLTHVFDKVGVDTRTQLVSRIA
jgi:DNA-binding CsgD family transcriptional regulator